VIIGAGFAGLTAAKWLARSPVEVTVVDRRNHHLFQPLLYQVATAGLGAPEIAAPIRRILRRHKRTRVFLAEVSGFDLAKKKVLFTDGELGYDFLIVGAGLENHYFGHDAWVPQAPGLKSIDDALDIRRRVLLAFEAAERETDPDRRKAWLTFVIIGGGATGVELAGALAELSRRTIRGEFRACDPASARILVVEGGDRLLQAFAPDIAGDAARDLQKLGVELRFGSLVSDIDAEGVRIGDEMIPAKTVLWAAGTRSSPLGEALGRAIDRQGRVLVEPDLSLPGHPEVFVTGDMAALKHTDGTWIPGVATAAIQEGRHAARNVHAAAHHAATAPFRYVDKGLLATIGRSKAVAQVFGWRFSGFLAWLLWVFIHILYLIGFRNRLVVLFEWARAYFTYSRSARVVLENTYWARERAPLLGPPPPR
jgi:NADH dehydrogenase